MSEERICVQAVVATEPVLEVVGKGTDMVSFLIQTNVQSFDLRIGGYTSESINVYRVVAFNNLARNIVNSVFKKQRIIVSGNLYIRADPRFKEGLIQAEIKADAVGHDLNWSAVKAIN
jgi:single-strand DNA-binding protein